MPSFQFTPQPVQQIVFTTQENSPITTLGPVQGPAGATGATGATGASGATIVTVRARKVPTGTKNGVNTTFTLPDASIVLGSLTVTLNGLEEPVTESGNTFIFADAPINSDTILCRYQVV